MSDSAPELLGFRRRCRLFSLAVSVVLLLTALLLGWSLVSVVVWVSAGAANAGHPHALALALVQMAPALCYLWALWAVSRGFARLADGAVFQLTVARALRHIGYAVIVGALLRIFAVTNLTRMIMHGHGGFAWFDLSGIVLAVVGVALVLLAQLIDRARDLQQELDTII